MADYATDANLRPDTPPNPDSFGRKRNTLPPAANLEAAVEQAIAAPVPPAAPPYRNYQATVPVTETAKLDFQFTGKVLKISATCLTGKEAKQLAEMINANAPFLPE